MNILIPHTWLLEHLDTKANPQQIQKYLSLCGPSVERIYEIEDDQVYDIEVTTNRVDSMSVRGIAREAAAILPQFEIPASLKKTGHRQQPNSIKKYNQAFKDSGAKALPLPKINNNPKLNRRTLCVVLSGVKRNPTPDWMGKRLLQTEMNIHDAVIDITNYITHELGHPCHAFDYDKLMNTGGEINIEEAKKGETFTTLDGESFETVGGEVVFKNGEGTIIDLPSIKGTANTSIDDSTKNVLLLLESITPEKVRFASMTHAIRTTAAQLMEKNVDPHLAESVLLMGAQLYQELCEAKPASQIYDDYPGEKADQKEAIRIQLAKFEQYLGLEIEVETITEILETLGCKVSISQKELIVTPPTFRPDLNIKADLVEEVARIYGYHRLPSKIMDGEIPLNRPTDYNFKLEDQIKHFLAASSWQEIYAYSMVSEEIALQSGYKLAEQLKLQNPLSEDRVYLRRSLIPSLQEVIAQNPNYDQMSVFEIAKAYHPSAKTLKGQALPEEELLLGMVSTKAYREIRADLENLLSRFYLNDLQIKQTGNREGELVLQGQKLGKIEVRGKNETAVEIKLAVLVELAKTHPQYQPLSKTNSLLEDMTFTLPAKTAVGEVIEKINGLSELVYQVTLKDVYQQNHTFQIEYLDKQNNLSAEDVKPVRQKIAQLLKKEFSAKLVGNV
jgi:phenylalanyl-tRNA synthetase beta chain